MKESLCSDTGGRALRPSSMCDLRPLLPRRLGTSGQEEEEEEDEGAAASREQSSAQRA